MDNTNTAPPTSQPVSSVPKFSGLIKAFIFVVVAFFLIVIAAYGAYKWEHNRAVKVENSETTQIHSLKSQVSQLQNQINGLKKNIATISRIAILGYGFQSAPGGGITVPVQLRNNDVVSHTVTVQVSFMNGDTQTLEVDTATLKNFSPGQEVTLTVAGTNKVAGFNNLKVEVIKVT